MDLRARILFFTNSVLIVAFAIVLSACGNPNRSESVLPAKTETCGGMAIQSRYIVHFFDGRWDYVENSNRENFRSTYVEAKIDSIDFIEYDQRIQVKEAKQFVPFSGIDNWGVSVIDAPLAWQKGWRGAGVTVAVIDSGVDVTHSQLAQQIAYNNGEIENNGIDDDGNGLIDDYAGYSFYDDSPDVSDAIGHGTHVSGIIAAQHTDTSLQIGYTQGIAPAAKILPVKFLGENGGSLSAALKGIDYAIKRGAKVINASWGGTGCSQSLRQKVAEASQQNVLFIAAAGNNGLNLERYPEYPAAFDLPLQITVGAIRSSLNMDSYSNYSRSLVHIFAPGTMVVSTVPGDSYAAFSGTSMAAPFVSAASAVLLGARPDMALTDVRNILFRDADQDPLYQNMTHGRLNLGAAANALGR